MARDKMFDPSFQKAFTEAILKENKVRVNWNLEHGSLLRRCAESCTWDDMPDDDDDDYEPDFPPQEVPAFEDELQAIPDAHQSTKPKPPKEDDEKEQFLPPSVTKPVEVDVKKLLYKGLSQEEEGRYQYLKKRYEKDPKDKFYYPIISSWEYGWTYGGDEQLKHPEHGRRQIIEASFFRRNDPQLKPRD